VLNTIAKKYIARHKIQVRVDFQKKYNAVVVIPVLADDMLFETLQSLNNAKMPQKNIAVLVVVNHSEYASPEEKQQNKLILSELQAHTQAFQFDLYSLALFDLPEKKSGVGVARKAGMDQALLHFVTYGNTSGIIVSLDADTVVQHNYFEVLFRHFKEHPKTNAVIFNFKHQPAVNDDLQQAIDRYELYLRYYIEALRWTGFPFAFYTIGSAFAVSAKAYVAVSGMSQNKAGEDFYFLHKVFPMGEIYAIEETTVFPSPRISHKTPFGTGQAVAELIENEFLLETYPFEWFGWLKQFFETIDLFYDASTQDIRSIVLSFHPMLQAFLKTIDFEGVIFKLQSNTVSRERFRKAFFIWFDGFKVVKFLNFTAQQLPKKDVSECYLSLLSALTDS